VSGGISSESIPEAIAPQAEGGAPQAALPPTSRGAFMVAAGILLSRVLGLARQRVFAHYFGSSMAAAAFLAALRIPNFLQNLFGEGALSASFIPVYAQLVGRNRRDEADRVAGAVFATLALVTSLLVALGIALAGPFTTAVAPGLEGETRELTVRLVRILFPGAGLLVISAWCLGVLNSHRRFFLSYAAPVVWNATIITTLLTFGGSRDLAAFAEIVAWGTVAGSFLQFAVQLPRALGQLGRFRLSLGWRMPAMRQVVRGFLPALIGRGVVQISAFVDLAYASLVTDRAIAVLSFSQTLYLLPVSLFGMSVSAAELPAMSQVAGVGREFSTKLRERLSEGLERIAFFVVPSAAMFLFLGDIVSGALFQTGRFGPADTRYAWFLLMGSGIGLSAATSARLYASAFYALKDTRTPLYFATVRVAVGAALALYAVRVLPGQLGVPAELGAIGITLASGLASWVEYHLLRRSLTRRVGPARLARGRLAALWASALIAAACAVGVKLLLVRAYGYDAGVLAQWGGEWLPPPHLHPALTALLVLGTYGAAYLALSYTFGVPQASTLPRRAFALLRRRASRSRR
jgi:putative peptidoglycan lipid II flippase